MATWYTADTPEAVDHLTAAWDDAPIENEELCSRLLSIARDQVVTYGPAEGENDDYIGAPPDRYVHAQLMLAQQVWNDARAVSDPDVGMDGFTFTPASLTKKIRQLIRPVDARPHVL